MTLSLTLISLGLLFLAGLAADEIGRRTRIPRVTLLIVVGLLVGPTALDIVPATVEALYQPIAAAALTMVAFLLGGGLSPARLRSDGPAIMVVSAAVVLASAGIVAGGLALAGTELVTALLLGGIAAATDPAATRDVIVQRRAEGPFARLVLGVVAVDDAWGLVAFSLLLVLARGLAGEGGLEALVLGFWEIGGALALGVALGAPAAMLTGRIRAGEPMLAEGLAVVFLCAGLALLLGVSYLLAGMACGITVRALAKHHTQPLHEVEHVEWPFITLFFVLAGASLEADVLLPVAALAGLAAALRVLARLVGGWTGGWIAGLPAPERTWIGLALLPQAGVAVGMALVAGDHFPELRSELLSVTIATTIGFELVGPAVTALALARAGERPRSGGKGPRRPARARRGPE